MASPIRDLFRYGVIAASMILVGCRGPSLSGLPATTDQAVIAMTSKLELVTRARNAAEYHSSRHDWRSVKIAVSEATVTKSEAEDIRAAMEGILRTARNNHLRAKRDSIAANREANRLADWGRSNMVSAAGGASSDSGATPSESGALARSHIAWSIAVAMAREKERAANALIEIDRLLDEIRSVAEIARRIGRPGRLTRTTPTVLVPDL